ncbi:cysteine hydrolase family protein [Nocardia nova]|uniref:cysteine hydrolase family protein n=1 Tax=Nocardia nova TaxID=37330 RepID=UPI00372220BA
MSAQFPYLDVSRTALLLMDFQTSLLQGVAQPEALLARVRRTQRAARRAGIHQVQVHVAFSPHEHAAIPAHNKVFAPLAGRGALAYGEPGTEIHPLLQEEGCDHVVTKTRVSAFSTTSLDRSLRERGIDTLLLAGMFTSGVVLSTVRDAADRDYRLLVLSDACADGSPDLHELLMRHVLPLHAELITVDSFDDATRTATGEQRRC